MSIYTCNECKDAAFQALARQMDGKILITREQAQAVVEVLSHNWVQHDLQEHVYGLVRHLEKELKQ